MSFFCSTDQEQFFKSYEEILKLFGRGNQSIITAFSNRLKFVNTYSNQYADDDINSITPGKTGYESNPNSNIYIKLIGFDKDTKSKAQRQHYFSHEISHAFSVAAQDVFSTRKKAGINTQNIPYFENTEIGNSEYLGVSGSIYKKMENGENENMIYGGGFCEIMTDLFAVASKVASNSNFRNQGITIDTVLKRPNNEWNKENIDTGYFPNMPLARLAIAAFSNYPNPQYQNILDSGGSIFSTMKTDTEKEVHINDFLYGSMCDPLYIAEEYDKIAGRQGAYFELCRPMDKLVDDCAYKKTTNIDDVKTVIQKLSTFAKLKTLIKVQEGVFSQEYADEIYKEFEKVKADVEKEYGILDREQLTHDTPTKITPTEISNASIKEMKKRPGFMSKILGKTHSRFQFLNRDKDGRRR